MASSGEERRARRAQERRQMILAAAARVFARKGFEKATTREIAQEADISEGTIYNYFSSKKQLVVALAEVVQAKLTAVMSELPSNGDNRANMAQAIEQALAVIADSAVVIRGLVTALWDQGPRFDGYLIPGAHRLIARVEEYLEAQVSAGVIRPCHLHTVARMVMGMVVYVTMPYLQGIELMPSAEQRCGKAELLVGVLFDRLRV